jgi:hypothetical protein
MKELRHHYEKDKRMGRAESINQAYRLKEEESKQLNQSIDYLTLRN